MRPAEGAGGFFAFVGINLLVFFAVGLDTFSLTAGALYAGGTILFAAVLYFVLDWRAFALGFVAGFAVLTVASGGTCTLFADPGLGG